MSIIQVFGTKTRLRNNELLAFGREIETAILEKGADTLKITDIFAEYQTKLQILDNGIIKVTKSAYTADMVIARKLRNNLHISIMGYIRLGKYHYIQEKKEAALRLSPLLKIFTGIQNKGFDDQTGFEYNFIQKLTSETYKADVELLNLTEWVKELQKINEKCALLTSKRSEEAAQKAIKGFTEANRPVFENMYEALVDFLNSLARINGDELYADLFAWWNARIDHYRVVISNHLGAGKGGQTGAGNKPPVTTSGSGSSGGDERPGEL